jgi:hypothetical protein
MMPDPYPGLAAAIVFAALLAAHGLADHWFQTDHQAIHKGDHDRPGQWACARHCAVHVVTAVPFLAATVGLLGAHVSWAGLIAGQVWMFVSHYVIDRRWTVRWAAARLGKQEFHDLGAPRRGFTVLAHRLVPARTPGGGGEEWGETRMVPLDRDVLGTGRYALDQTAHVAALFVSALLTALI